MPAGGPQLASAAPAPTGALNRRALVDRLDDAIARARWSGGTCAVVVIDVDHLKRINDTFAHAAGDAALRQLVATATARLRAGDALGRLGGEEFAVVLEDAEAAGAMAYAEQLRRGVVADGMTFTISAGVAALRDEALLATADAALYRAKRGGRDRVLAA